MACVFYEDFEWLGTANAEIGRRYDENTSSLTQTTTGIGGMTGRVLAFSPLTDSRHIGTTIPEITEGVLSAAAFIAGGTGITTRTQIALLYGTTINVAIRLNSDGTLNVLRNATVIGSASTAIVPFGRRFRIEVAFVIADGTSGEVKVRLDTGAGMTEVLSVTGVDTNETGGSVNRFRIYGQQTPLNMLWDDIYIDNDKTWTSNDFTFLRLAPSADVSKASTPSTGSTAFAVIDEAPFTTSDFTTFTTTGEDVMDFADLSSTPDDILGLGVTYFASKTVGDVTEFRSRILSNTDYANGTTRGLNATSLVYSDLFPLDPQGNTAWTKARVDAAKLVAERVS